MWANGYWWLRFWWLRFRDADSGGVCVCRKREQRVNDTGVRKAEAVVTKTIRDWLGRYACAELEIPDLMADDRTVILARLGSTQQGTRYRWRWLAPPMQPMLDDFARRYPETRSRIVTWFTGQPHPDLDRVSAILFFMQDPLRKRFPLDFQQAVALADAARARGIRLVNPPEQLSNTIKSTQARLWRDAGIPTPRHHSYSSYEELMSLSASLDYPVLVKSDLLHVQAHMHVCRTAAELKALQPAQIECPGSVADFVDTRATYREICPDSVWGRLYHKKRACLVGSRVINNHVFFSTNPIVGASPCTLAGLDSAQGCYRPLVVLPDREPFRRGWHDGKDVLS